MNILAGKLNQTLVYWASPVQAGDGGATFDDPVELSGRWTLKQEKFVDFHGEERISHSLIYLDQDVDIGGYLFLGGLGDLNSDEDPQKQDEARRIMQFKRITNVKGTEDVRKAWL